MDTKNLFFECLNNVPNEIHFEVDWAFEISNRIDSILKERRITQKEFAQMVGKRESEVCKWLKGTHNLTALYQSTNFTLLKSRGFAAGLSSP